MFQKILNLIGVNYVNISSSYKEVSSGVIITANGSRIWDVGGNSFKTQKNGRNNKNHKNK